MSRRDRAKSVHLGYELGTGADVEIPIRHLIVTGQTQEAGKTTALEALIARSRLKALAFVTKRGEGAFEHAHPAQPYFKEEADWEYVVSLLEAARREKLKFERSWIIEASEGAETLAEVHDNVKRMLVERTRGIDKGVFRVLDKYLEKIVPQIASVRWASRVELRAGVNVMDLTALSIEMQSLVIRASMLWILEKASDTVVVVPEAWKFVPQGRGTPVKRAAEEYIRQGAGLGNYLWLDSQDIAGVDKTTLKMVPVWILGVQREANEVARTLEQIPDDVAKPTKREIMRLQLGQFIACWSTHMKRVYVQPEWLDEETARAIALGDMRVEDITAPPPEEDDVGLRQELDALKRDNARLQQQLAAAETHNDRVSRGTPAKVVRVEREVDRFDPSLEIGEIRTREDGKSRRAAPTEENAGVMSEELYQSIKTRLVAEAPKLLQVLVKKHAIDVDVVIETVKANGDSWIGAVAQLIAEGFLDEPTKVGVVFKEAARRGAKGIPARASEAINKLFSMGFLTKEADGFQAVPDMKDNINVERRRR